jgi:hypothetical protein
MTARNEEHHQPAAQLIVHMYHTRMKHGRFCGAALAVSVGNEPLPIVGRHLHLPEVGMNPVMR